MRKFYQTFRLKSGIGITSDRISPEDTYPVYGGNGLRGYTDEFTHEGTYLLVGRQGALCGNVHMISGQFWASEHALVVYPTIELNQRWLYYVLSTMNLGQYSVATAQPGLSVDNLSTLRLPFPPIEIQSKTADYLDSRCVEIDDLIAKKRGLLNLLAEKRSALVTQAVTKGLDPNAAMKPSGIDWLGDIPAHWEVIPLWASVGKLESGVSVNSKDTPASDDELGILKTSCVYSGAFDAKENKVVFEPAEIDRLKCPVRGGEIVISRMNTPELVGASGLVGRDHGNLFLPDRLWQTNFVENPSITSDFAFLFLSSTLYRSQISSLATGSSPSMKNISKDDFLKLKVASPPRNEQREIVEQVAVNVEEIRTSQELIERAIERLVEYRTAIITKAVTGELEIA